MTSHVFDNLETMTEPSWPAAPVTITRVIYRTASVASASPSACTTNSC